MRATLSTPVQLPLAWPEDPRAVAAEVAALPRECRLARAGDWEALEAEPAEIPTLLLELGRLREACARAAGRGTGRARDLDRFDTEQRHLVVWSRARRELAAACRVGRSDELVARAGLDALSTTLRFEHGAELLDELGPSLELGRFFVRPERRRSLAPALLWRALGVLVAREPRYRHLFGALSLAPEQAAREPVLALQARGASFRDALRASPAPVPAAAAARESRLPLPLRALSRLSAEVRGLALHAEVEGAEGGESALEALVVVDLGAATPRALERFLGREGARAFRATHGLLAGAR